MSRLLVFLVSVFVSIPLSLVTPAIAQISDVEAPHLVSISFSPSAVDVRTTSQIVTVTAEITDDLSGVDFASVYFYSPGWNEYTYGYLYRVSGTALSGSYAGTVLFRPGIEVGDWIMDYFSVWDTVGNNRYLSGDALAALQPARIVTVTSIPQDTTPHVTGLRITPQAIDVSASDQTITIQVDFAGDVVGLSLGDEYTFSPTLVSPSGQQRRYGEGNRWTVLPGGTPTHATWQMDFVIPNSSEGGRWSIERIDQIDSTKRWWTWTTTDLVNTGLNPYFQITSPAPDMNPPTIYDIAVLPGFVNTTLAAQPVTISLRVTDAETGVTFDPTTASISWLYGPWFRSPSGQQSNVVVPWPGYARVSGNAQNGTWKGSFTLPRYAEAGTWKIGSIKLRDRVNNELNLDQAQLESMGLQRTIVVTQPTGVPDNTINSTLGGTVADDVFGTKAQITVPPNVLSTQTTVSIDVFADPIGTPTPVGYSAPGTLFVNISLNPHPTGLLPAPGLTVTVPVYGALMPGTVLTLYRVDTATGTLVAARNVSGGIVTGAVDPGGETATFSGIASLSTVVGLIPSGPVVGDANLDGVVSCLDYVAIKQAFGKRRGQSGYLASADLNNDGVISVNDLMVVARLLPAGCPAN